MKLRFIPIWATLALLAGAVGTSASAQSTSTAAAPKSTDPPPPRQVKVAIDPRSSEGMERALITNGFRDVCSNVSIIRDESEAEYVIFASGACPGFLCHYYITLYDKQGKVVFATDKHDGKNAIRAFCQFMHGQK
jgi:hypothetical protein